jgi:hypothetical protein
LAKVAALAAGLTAERAARVALEADLRAEIEALKPKPRKPSDADIEWFRRELDKHGDDLLTPFLAATFFVDAKTAGMRLARLVGHPVDGFVVRKVDETGDGTSIWLVERVGNLGNLGFR